MESTRTRESCCGPMRMRVQTPIYSCFLLKLNLNSLKSSQGSTRAYNSWRLNNSENEEPLQNALLNTAGFLAIVFINKYDWKDTRAFQTITIISVIL